MLLTNRKKAQNGSPKLVSKPTHDKCRHSVDLQKKMLIKRLGLRIFELKPVPQDLKGLVSRISKENHESNTASNKAMSAPVSQHFNHLQSKDTHVVIRANTIVQDQKDVWIGSLLRRSFSGAGAASPGPAPWFRPRIEPATA